MDPRGKLFLANSLYDCIEDTNINNLKVVLSNDADPNIIIPEHGISPFHFVTGSEDGNFAFEVIKLFLQKGGDPNVRSSDGLTPVHIASAWGKTQILHLLLMNGGNPWQQDDYEKNAFHYAFEEKQWKIMDLLQKFRFFDQNKNEFEDDIKYKYEKLETYLNTPLASPLIRVNRSIQTSVLILNNNPSEGGDHQMNSQQKAFEPKRASSDLSTNFLSELKSKLLDRSRESNSPIPKESASASTAIPKKRITNKIKGLSDTLVSLLPKSSNHKITTGNKNVIDSSSSCEMRNLPTPLEPNKIASPPPPPPLPPPPILSPSQIEIFETGSQENLLENEQGVIIEEWLASHSCQIPSITPPPASPQINNNSNNQTLISSTDESESLDYCSFSATEEYKYTDEEKGIVLFEKRIIKLPQDSLKSKESENEVFESLLQSSSSSDETDVQTSDYATDSLRQQLNEKGYKPGPIVRTTKKIYIHKLRALNRDPSAALPSPLPQRPAFSAELERTLQQMNWHESLQEHALLEQQLTEQFNSPDPQRRWREGIAKTSFCYLLLDPRRTRNLPCQTDILTFQQSWERFLSSIFYVGKGKRSRPYAHLYEAVTHYRNNTQSNSSKIEHILDIWNSGGGVVCLHIFQNIIPVEAFTREAAIIDTLGLEHLKNSKNGEYYGVATTWSRRQRRMLGIYLLYRAMAIFINEGERQIRPADINK